MWDKPQLSREHNTLLLGLLGFLVTDDLILIHTDQIENMLNDDLYLLEQMIDSSPLSQSKLSSITSISKISLSTDLIYSTN